MLYVYPSPWKNCHLPFPHVSSQTVTLELKWSEKIQDDDYGKKVRENLFGHQFPIVNNSPQISESEICASAISRTFSVQTVPLLLSFLTWLLRQERLLMASSHLSCFSYVMSRQLVLAIKHVQATEEWLVSKFKEYGNDCIFHLHECQCWCQPECYPASTVAADGPL